MALRKVDGLHSQEPCPLYKGEQLVGCFWHHHKLCVLWLLGIVDAQARLQFPCQQCHKVGTVYEGCMYTVCKAAALALDLPFLPPPLLPRLFHLLSSTFAHLLIAFVDFLPCGWFVGGMANFPQPP